MKTKLVFRVNLGYQRGMGTPLKLVFLESGTSLENSDIFCFSAHSSPKQPPRFF